MKFNLYQQVIITGFIINDIRYEEVSGIFMGMRYYGEGKNKALVKINSVMIQFDIDRLIDYDEYYQKKRQQE